MAMIKPVLWCEPLVCAQRYRVFFVDADDPRLCGKEAITIWEDSLVLISNDVSDARAVDMLAHEIAGHVVPEAYGDDQLLQEKNNISNARWRAFEEDLARSWAVHVVATWMVNGWLVLPKVPRRVRQAKPVQLVAAKTRRTKR